jgi:imidazolonepropionase-like amidohydrolase
MSSGRRDIHLEHLAAAAVGVCLAWASLCRGAETLVVRGDVVHTMAGPAITAGVVVVEGGKIRAVGPAATTPIPPNARELRGAVVTPGLVDAHSVVGLSGYLNQPQDQDQLDPVEAIQPELRAIDAYNPQERLIEWLRGFGVTTIHTGHAPGALVSGQTMVVKLAGTTADAAVLQPVAMVAAVTPMPTTDRPRISSEYSSPAIILPPSSAMSRRSPMTVRSEVTAPAMPAVESPLPVTKPSPNW